jgi:hypothetical protein
MFIKMNDYITLHARNFKEELRDGMQKKRE